MPARILGRSLAPASGVDTVPARPSGRPDVGYEARWRLAKLRDCLAAAIPRQQSPWKEPELFFCDQQREAERRASQSSSPGGPFEAVSETIAAELPFLCESVEARRAARALGGLREAADVLASKCAAARDLVDLLAVPDDEAILVLNPENWSGLRLTVRGVADVGQFHVLLAAAIVEPRDTAMAREQPVPQRLVLACRNSGQAVPAGVPMVMEARFQLYSVDALQKDGSLPRALSGCGHWLWPTTPLAAVPRVEGMRVILLGPPAYTAKWEVSPRFAGLPAELRVTGELGPLRVAEQLSRLTGTEIVPPVLRLPERPRSRAA